MSQIRLYLEIESIKANQIIKISGNDFNYLIRVMRKKIGDEISIFNNKNGQWQAKITNINKRDCDLKVIEQTLRQYNCPRITLAFAPVKNVRVDFVAAKATELGITNFQPIITKNSIVDKVNNERFKANIKEACEQCQRVDLPTIQNITTLANFIKNIKANQILILCNESGNGKKASTILNNISYDKQKDEIIIFIGPEGGFSKEEFDSFSKLDNIYSISLGPRILRADTAAISAITLVEEFLGDWE